MQPQSLAKHPLDAGYYAKHFKFYLFIYLFVGHVPQRVGVLVPLSGIEHMPPAVEARSLNHWTTREVPQSALNASSPCVLRNPPAHFTMRKLRCSR